MFDFEILTPYIEIIFPMSLIIAIMLLMVPVMNKRYVAKARYFVWLMIAVRLLIPFDIWHNADSRHLINADLPNFAIVRNDVLDYIQQQEDIADNNIVIAADEQLERPAFATFPRIVLHSVIEWVWSLGSIGLLTYFIIQYIFTKAKMKRLSIPDNNGQEMLDRLCQEMIITQKLNIYRCGYINTAMIMGIFSPTIFIPDTETSEDVLEMILRHELTHYKRKDILYKFILMLACCMHWFNPLVWLMDKQAHKDVELCCDDDVIAGQNEEFKHKYSDSILDIAKFNVSKKTAFSTCFAIDKENLVTRFKNIYDTNIKKSGKSLIAGILVLCLSSTLLISCTDNSKSEYSYTASSVISNNNKYMFIAEDENNIYFKDAVKIKKMSKLDNSETELYTFDANIYEIPTDLEYVDGRIYVFTTLGDIVSMDSNGENILKAKIPEEAINTNAAVKKYIAGNQLYYITDKAYKIVPDTLALELTDYPATFWQAANDGSAFVAQQDGDYVGLYKTSETGELVLFSSNNEGVWSSHINITNNYVFYVANEKGDFSKYCIYRVDLSGENKILIKEVPLDNYSFNVNFDNRYIYILLGQNKLIKIDKRTLKETDISVSAQAYQSSVGDICEGKLFETINSCYYIDLDTGEKVNLSSYWTE